MQVSDFVIDDVDWQNLDGTEYRDLVHDKCVGVIIKDTPNDVYRYLVSFRFGGALRKAEELRIYTGPNHLISKYHKNLQKCLKLELLDDIQVGDVVLDKQSKNIKSIVTAINRAPGCRSVYVILHAGLDQSNHSRYRNYLKKI